MPTLNTLGLMDNVGANSVGTIRIAEGGGRLYAALLEPRRPGNVILTRADLLTDVARIMIKVNNKFAWELEMVDYLNYLDHYARPGGGYDPVSGILPIHFYQPWLNDQLAKFSAAWPIDPALVQRLDVELRFTAASTVDKVELWSHADPLGGRAMKGGAAMPTPLGSVTKLEQFAFNKATTGRTIVKNLPRDTPIQSLMFRHLDATKQANVEITEFRILMGGVEVYRTDPVREGYLSGFRQNPDLNIHPDHFWMDFMKEGMINDEPLTFGNLFGQTGDLDIEITGPAGDYMITRVGYGPV